MKKLDRAVDIHTHFLPFVDDGSPSVEDSIVALEKYNSLGVKDIILTPHYRHLYLKTGEELKQSFREFCDEVKKRLDINLYLGQEIYYTREISHLAKAKKLITLNNTKYVLLEFNFEKETDIADVVYEFIFYGYTPIVAHLERYSYANLDMAYEIKSLGGLIQVNADSLVDKKKKDIYKKAMSFVKAGLVDFVASDYHTDREILLDKAYLIVAKKCGTAYAEKVFYENALDIIK